MWDGWNGWAWFGPLHFIIPLLFWAVIITAVVLLVRYAAGSGALPRAGRRSPGLDVLEERYARGEINRDEYLQKKGDIAA
jgi:putative membrane protein